MNVKESWGLIESRKIKISTKTYWQSQRQMYRVTTTKCKHYNYAIVLCVSYIAGMHACNELSSKRQTNVTW